MMRKTAALSLIISVLFPLSILAWSGSGTQSDPYLITSAEDLTTLSTNVNKGTTYSGVYFKITQDITFTGTNNFIPIGYSSTNAFAGTIDGDNKTIRGINISNNNSYSAAGLFGYLAGIVENVFISDMTVLRYGNNSSRAKQYVSFIAGYNSGTINGCKIISGSLNYNSNEDTRKGYYATYVGSFAGNNAGSISGCYLDGTSTNSIRVCGKNYTGGLAGENTGTIEYCYAKSFYTYHLKDDETYGKLVGGTNPVGYKDDDDATTFYYLKTGSDEKYMTADEVAAAKDVLASSEYFAYDADGNLVTTLEKKKQDEELNAEFADALKGEIKLYINNWNLVGSIGSTFSVFNNNTGSVLASDKTTAKAADIAALDYDYSSNAWSTEYLYADDNMTRGVGYFVWAFDKSVPTDWTVETPQGEDLYNANGYVTLSSVSYSDAALDVTALNLDCQGSANNSGYWYALSNPFNTYLTKNEILTGLTNESGTVVYVYDPTLTTSSKWQEAKAVMPGQGFMIQRNSTGKLTGTITKPNHSAKKKESTDIRDLTRIKFTAQTEDLTKDVYARYQYNNEVSNGFDNVDSYVILSSYSDIVEPYFVVEQRNIYINEFASLPYECPINFHTAKDNDVEFYLTNNPNDMEISIVDLFNDTETIISDGTKFTFTAYEGENEGRFVIKFAPTNSSDDDDDLLALNQAENTQINIYNNNRDVFVNADGLQNIQIINSLGQVVYNKNIAGASYSCNLNNVSGAYIVKVKTDSGTKTQKIIVE